MYECETKHLVPEELMGKENTLFCNIEELCRFHGNVFLPQLSSSILDVGKVAELFLAQVKRRRSSFITLLNTGYILSFLVLFLDA